MITPLGPLGGAQNKVAGAPLTFSPSRAVPVGRVLVLWCSTDSVHNVGGPHGPMQQRWAIHDSVGNVWSTLGGATDGRAFFKIGASSHIFITQVRRALTTSSVITLTNQAEANVTARSLWVEEFDFHGELWAVADNGPQTKLTVAADPDPISMHGLVAGFEYMLLHCLGAEGPNTDAYTWDANYTPITGTGTTGGTDATNVHVRGGYRIATLTSDTVDVTSLTADRDYTQVFVAVRPVEVYPFPTTPILDDFNRPDENPLDNGTWFTDRSSGPHVGTTPSLLQVASHLAKGPGGGFWNTLLHDCVEVFVDVTVAPVIDQGAVVAITHGTGQAEDANAGGHMVYWQLTDAGDTIHHSLSMGNLGNAGGIGREFFRAWVDLLAGRKLGSALTGVPAPGSTIGVDRLFLDLNQGDGWEQAGAVLRASTVIGDTGYLGISVNDSTGRLDNFGGGEVPCFAPVLGHPQIMRYV